MTNDNQTVSTRRRLLHLFGWGAAATAVGTVGVSGRVFAKQYLGRRAELELPDMVYDSALQMMVDPVTRRPLHEGGEKIRVATAIVTTNCSDCPKNDGCSDNYAC